jgi:hypothetical protein
MDDYSNGWVLAVNGTFFAKEIRVTRLRKLSLEVFSWPGFQSYHFFKTSLIYEELTMLSTAMIECNSI